MSNQNENERALDKVNELRLISFTVILFHHPQLKIKVKRANQEAKKTNDDNGSSCELQHIEGKKSNLRIWLLIEIDSSILRSIQTDFIVNYNPNIPWTHLDALFCIEIECNLLVIKYESEATEHSFCVRPE